MLNMESSLRAAYRGQPRLGAANVELYYGWKQWTALFLLIEGSLGAVIRERPFLMKGSLVAATRGQP